MSNEKAVSEFIAHKAEIDAQLARLDALSGEHFEVEPKGIHYGHVGDLARIAEKLRQITDVCFSEGECA